MDVLAEQERWRAVRRYLNGHRYELARAASCLYPDIDRVAGTALLTRRSWIPGRPVDLRQVRLAWAPDARAPGVNGTEPESSRVRPPQQDGTRFVTYAGAIEGLDPPRLFANRISYRLTGASLADGGSQLTFCQGAYFDGVNVGEAAAHEFAAVSREQGTDETLSFSALPFRARVGDPTGLARRAVLPAVSMLTLRRDRATGQASFVLHWRDPASVAHGGGLYQVMPVGVFQPSSDTPQAVAADFDLWRCVVREYSEEFLGTPENYATGDVAFDYDAWPLYARLGRARQEGALQAWCLGLGVDPLTLATDILAVTVIDDDAFDEVFGHMVTANTEGAVVSGDSSIGFPFAGATISRLTAAEPMQPAGAAVLALAWRHRTVLGLREAGAVRR